MTVSWEDLLEQFRFLGLRLTSTGLLTEGDYAQNTRHGKFQCSANAASVWSDRRAQKQSTPPYATLKLVPNSQRSLRTR